MAFDQVEYYKQYRLKNKERISQTQLEYRLKNKERIAKYKKEYYQRTKNQNPEYYKECYNKLVSRKESNKRSFALHKFSNQKYSAKVRNIEWDLDKETMVSLIESSTHCAISGIKLVFKVGHKHAPSIDRKNSSKGYIPGNIQVVSTIVNKMKQDLSIRDFKSICRAIVA